MVQGQLWQAMPWLTAVTEEQLVAHDACQRELFQYL